MSNFSKKLAVGFLGLSLCGVVLPLAGSNNTVYAVEQKKYEVRELTNDEIKLIDNYVEIKNDRFHLKDNANLTPELKFLAKKYIEKTNESLDNYQGKIFVDYSSKKIIGSSLLSRAPGKNDLEWHWNFVRVYVDAGALNIILQGGVAGGLSLLFTKVSFNPHLGAAIGAMVAQAVQQNDGIWFDYNYFVGLLTMNWGIQ